MLAENPATVPLSIYFDNNATTNLIAPVIEALQELLSGPLGNPSSAHSYADYSRELIAGARSSVAELLCCPDSAIYFNSGATEGNATILRSLINMPAPKKLITTRTEHASVRKNAEYLNAQGVEVDFVDVDANGELDMDQYFASLKTAGTKLVSVIWANGETGVLQDVHRLAALAKEQGALFHTDASQAVGRIHIDLSESDIDFLTFTGHKLHAPQGVGVLYARSRRRLTPLLLGGEQEFHLRAGTENILHIHALGAAVEDRLAHWDHYISMLEGLRDSFESMLLSALPVARVNASRGSRVSNTSSIQFIDIDGQALLAQLDIAGLYCSQTSACTSMMPEPSATLRAMGLSEDEAFSSLRFSFAVTNKHTEIVEGISRIVQVAEKLSPLSLYRERV